MNPTAQCLREAWHRMFQSRTCPPLSVLIQGGAQVASHLSMCLDCREALAKAETYAKAGSYLARIPLPNEPQTPVNIGDIRRLRPKGTPDTWFDTNGRYYNPPLVIVLAPPDANDCVRVAQIFDEEDLRDISDIPLENGSDFAEAWNIYEIPQTALATKAYQRVDTSVVARILAAADQPIPTLDDTSPVSFFRHLERAIASFFRASLQQPPNLLAQHEARIHSLFAQWTEHVTPLPEAAAEQEYQSDDGSNMCFRLPCLVIQEDTLQQYAAEIHVDWKHNGFVATAFCPLKSPNQTIVPQVRCGSTEPDANDIRTSVLNDGTVRIMAQFTGGDCTPDDLKIVLLLSTNNR